MAGNLRAFLAEFLGTFALVFLGAGSVCMDAVTGGKVGTLGVALAHGLAFATMGYALGHVSGGHYNPAVTAAMLSNRRIEPGKAVFYVVAQLLGASAAALVLRAALIGGHPQLCGSAPFLGACDLAGVGYKAATLLEAIATFLLVLVVCASCDLRGPAGLAPLAAGLTLAACMLAIGPLTGGALNPARAFGPALAAWRWSNIYVYWIGPLAGALAAAALYENLFLEKRK